MWLVVLVALLKSCPLAAQSSERLDNTLPPSPCPSVFSYEGRTAETDRWYGVVLVTTDSPLTGLRLDVSLTRPAFILGNWEGEVMTNDNRKFTILNLDKKLFPGPPISMRIFVRFAEDQELPVLEMIALNGRQICPPLQVGLYQRSSIFDKPWRPSELETSLKPEEPLEIDSDFQASLSRPLNPNELSSTRKTTTDHTASNGWNNGKEFALKQPTSNGRLQTTKRPSSGYDSNNESRRPLATRKPSSGYESDSESGQPPTPRRPSYNTDGESKQPLAPRRPSYITDGESERPLAPSRPTYDTDGESGKPQVTRRPSNGYDSDDESGRPATSRRPSSEYDSEPGRQPTPRHPSGGYDSDGEFERQPASRWPSSDYYSDGEFGGKPALRRPSSESVKPPTPRRPSSNYDSHGESGGQLVPRQPSSGYDSDSESGGPLTRRRPSGSYERELQDPSARQSNGNYNNTEEYERLSRNQSGTYDTSNDFQTQSATRQPSSEPSTTERAHSGFKGISNRKPFDTSTTKRSPLEEMYVATSRRPTTLNVGERPPDKEVQQIKPSHKSTTPGRPERQEITTHSSDNGPIQCGRIHISATPLVTHGQSTSRGQWPWHAALYKAKGINLTYICGGTLISPSAIITAAHCVTKMIGNWPEDPDNLVVYLGKYHLKLWSEGGVQNRQVAEVHVHPQYNSSDFHSDLAVLVLSTPADFTQYVRPVCLWGNDNTDLRDIEGRDGYVVGWGYDEESRVTEELMMARMPIVSQQTCLWSYPEFFSIFTNNRTYCAGFNNVSFAGTSVCNGDSGGGMVLPDEQADGSSVWRLRGLVSISVSKEDKRVCDTKHYVVFTDLAKYHDWIVQHIK